MKDALHFSYLYPGSEPASIETEPRVLSVHPLGPVADLRMPPLPPIPCNYLSTWSDHSFKKQVHVCLEKLGRGTEKEVSEGRVPFGTSNIQPRNGSRDRKNFGFLALLGIVFSFVFTSVTVSVNHSSQQWWQREDATLWLYFIKISFCCECNKDILSFWKYTTPRVFF